VHLHVFVQRGIVLVVNRFCFSSSMFDCSVLQLDFADFCHFTVYQ
jgi:hypothetical protein